MPEETDNPNNLTEATASIRIRYGIIIIDVRAPLYEPEPDEFIQWSMSRTLPAAEKSFHSWVDEGYRTVVRITPRYITEADALLMLIRRTMRYLKIAEVDEQPEWIKIEWAWPAINYGVVLSYIEGTVIEEYT